MGGNQRLELLEVVKCSVTSDFPMVLFSDKKEETPFYLDLPMEF